MGRENLLSAVDGNDRSAAVGVVARRKEVELGARVGRLDAEHRNEGVGQEVGHDRFALRSKDLIPEFRHFAAQRRRHVDEEGHAHDVCGQGVAGVAREIGMRGIVEERFAVVGDVDHDGTGVTVVFDDVGHYAIII